MAKIFAVLFVIVAIQGCLARPKQATEKSTVDQLANQAKATLEDISNKIEKNAPSVDEIAQTLNTHTQTAATQIKDIITKLKEESKAHEGEISTAAKQAQKKLEEAATNLQNAVGPEVTAKAKQLQSTFETNLKSTVAEIKKFADEVQPKLKDNTDSLNKFWQDAMNQLTTIINDTKTAVDAKVEEHQKTHKH